MCGSVCLSPSSVVRFRVILPEDFVFLEGTAVVEWHRSAEAMSDGPPGMALRFVTLSPQNQELVEQLVQDHIDADGTPFDLEDRHQHHPDLDISTVLLLPSELPLGEGASLAASDLAALGVPAERGRLDVRAIHGRLVSYMASSLSLLGSAAQLFLFFRKIEQVVCQVILLNISID